MKCPDCVKHGMASKVYIGSSSATLMSCQPFYDEDGRYHNHDPNTTTTDYRCSNGHRWTESSRTRCWCEKDKP